MGFDVLAPPGAYHNATAAGQICDPCTCGTWQDLAGQNACNSCGAAEIGSSANWPYVSDEAHCTAIPCGAYKTSVDGVNSMCDTDDLNYCPAGFAGVSGEGDTFGNSCERCPCGSFQPLEGQCACVECVAGTIGIIEQGKNVDGNYADAEHCAICSTGTFSLEHQEGICETDNANTCTRMCPAGTYGEFNETKAIGLNAHEYVGSNTLAASHCISCPAGWSQPAEGQVTCERCDEGEFSAEGDASCHTCEFDQDFGPCSATCSACDASGNTLNPPQKSGTSSLATHGYDLEHTNAATAQCSHLVPPSGTIECNNRCCPSTHQCHSEFSCGFVQHASGEYAIQVSHKYDNPNQVHRCHLLEDGFGGSECKCECYDSGDDGGLPDQPGFPGDRRLADDLVHDVLGL